MIFEIDIEIDGLLSDIAGTSRDVCSNLISKLNTLIKKIITVTRYSVKFGIEFSIAYPKLALILIGLAYLQYPLCARVINATVSCMWFITSYLLRTTTSGKKIANFVNGIIIVYDWLKTNGLDRISDLLVALDEIHRGVKRINANIQALHELAERLGIDITELIQIVMSMQSTFGGAREPASGPVSQFFWNMLGNVAVPVVLERLGAGAAAAGPGMLGMGGGKRKKTRKSKTNKKRKSKSNKNRKTKTRRR